MRRFFLYLALFFAACGGLLALKLSSLPWEPRTAFDIVGILWLLQNFGKIVAYGLVLGMGILAALSIRAAIRVPSRRSDLASEQQRLINHLLIDPIRPTTERQIPPRDTPPSTPAT